MRYFLLNGFFFFLLSPLLFAQVSGDEEYKLFHCEGQLEIKETDGGKYKRLMVGQKLYLLNRHLDTVQTGETDDMGHFSFKFLDASQGYLLILEQTPELKHITKINLAYNFGLSNKSLKPGPDQSFKIEIIRNKYTDVSDKTLLQALQEAQQKAAMRLHGSLFMSQADQRVPISDQKIHLKNEKGWIIQSVKTSKEGQFEFRDVPKDEKINIVLDKQNNVPDGSRVFLAQTNGSLIREFIKDKDGFHFEILPADFTVLEPAEEVIDPALNTEKLLSIGKRAEKAPVIIAEPLFYQEGAFEVNGRLTESLDKVALILKTEPQLILEINSHTDAKGSDAANLELSDKRAKAAAAYLVLERNIAPTRVKGIGFGESKLINNCKDPAKCSEEENAANRRTEFIFSKKP